MEIATSFSTLYVLPLSRALWVLHSQVKYKIQARRVFIFYSFIPTLAGWLAVEFSTFRDPWAPEKKCPRPRSLSGSQTNAAPVWRPPFFNLLSRALSIIYKAYIEIGGGFTFSFLNANVSFWCERVSLFRLCALCACFLDGYHCFLMGLEPDQSLFRRTVLKWKLYLLWYK